MTMIDLTDAGRKIAALSWGRPEGGEWNTKSPLTGHAKCVCGQADIVAKYGTSVGVLQFDGRSSKTDERGVWQRVAQMPCAGFRLGRRDRRLHGPTGPISRLL